MCIWQHNMCCPDAAKDWCEAIELRQSLKFKYVRDWFMVSLTAGI